MSDNNEFLKLEAEIVNVLKEIYDPEIPLNIYDLGLIYDIDISENNDVKITMTLTAPNCPAADYIVQEVNDQVKAVGGINTVEVDLVFDPPWDQNMLTDEAKLELGMM
ncbi:MAG: DUF59 domain-containing protein [Bacteroidetes bacterium]|jgi:FeS assembly SUF system protein|nr:DUF59 domain-containing protein [Bacteroidota bacterium]